MAIWQSRPVDQVPEVVLEDWRILETGSGARHLVGLRQCKGTVRVSSAVVSIDLVTGLCTTCSGRKYVLEGAPSAALSESHTVWQEWCQANHVHHYRDITDELLRGLA